MVCCRFSPHRGCQIYPIPGPLYIVFTSLFCLTVTYTFWILYRSWDKVESDEKKWDYKLLFFAQLYGFVTGSLSFLPVYGVPFPQYNLLLMPLWQFLLAYSMVRYRLFDPKEVVQAVQKDKLAAIGLLAASVNHEIKSPLFVIKGQAELLLRNMERGTHKNLPESEREERIEETLRRTIEQAERIVSIAQRLTDFSKPASLADTKEKISLDEIVENVLSFVSYGLKIENIEVEKSINPALTLQANPKETEQILLNLVINASQAMEKQAGKIKIEAQEKKERIEIRVSETDPGIPSDQINRIFEPFFTTKPSGTGLGLYITKQLVERNSGRISAASHPGRGTTFTLEFRGGTGG